MVDPAASQDPQAVADDHESAVTLFQSDVLAVISIAIQLHLHAVRDSTDLGNRQGTIDSGCGIAIREARAFGTTSDEGDQLQEDLSVELALDDEWPSPFPFSDRFIWWQTRFVNLCVFRGRPAGSANDRETTF